MKVCDICKRDLEEERGFRTRICKGYVTYEQYDFCKDCLNMVRAYMGFDKEEKNESEG